MLKFGLARIPPEKFREEPRGHLPKRSPSVRTLAERFEKKSTPYLGRSQITGSQVPQSLRDLFYPFFELVFDLFTEIRPERARVFPLCPELHEGENRIELKKVLTTDYLTSISLPTNSTFRRLDFHALSITLLATVASHNGWDFERLAEEWNTHRAQVFRTDYNESPAATPKLSLTSPTFPSTGFSPPPPKERRSWTNSASFR